MVTLFILSIWWKEVSSMADVGDLDSIQYIPQKNQKILIKNQGILENVLKSMAYRKRISEITDKSVQINSSENITTILINGDPLISLPSKILLNMGVEDLLKLMQNS